MSSLVTEHAKRIHQSIVHGIPMGMPEPAARITRSWQRCIHDYGLDPASTKEPAVLTGPALRQRQEKLGQLVSVAQVEMLNLYQQLSGSGFAILLTDTDGVVLNFTGDPIFTEMASKTGMLEGAVWDERHQGTNGIGTCLYEKTPVVVHHDEHFLAQNIGLTCSASPIFDPDGELIAVLDASSESRYAQQHTLVLVNMSAQTLENRLFLSQFKDDFVLRFHSRPEFVNTLGEGLLAFTEEGKLLAANRSAKFQLGLQREDKIRGRDIGQVFNISLAGLIERGARHWYHPLPLHAAANGSRFFALVNPPQRAVGSQTPAGAPVPHAPIIPERRRAQPASAAGNEFTFETLEFGDPVMAQNVKRARRVLNRDIPVLITGETGTGKEVFAKTLHCASARADKPFVAVNCAAIPESLIESELFGYRAGAFTGASREGKRGKILQANHGTLFLDEIGDMPFALQARLLRVLEEREVVSLGSETPVRVDFQLVSATHCDLQELVAQGGFREDLYYRLQGITISLPALRERQDKRALIQHVLQLQCDDDEYLEIEEDAMRVLEQYPWPGNVRQLRNLMRCALAMRDGNTIRLSDLPPEILGGVEPVLAQPQETLQDDFDDGAPLNALEAAMRESLLRELENHHWNITSVAQQLKVSRNTLYRKMKRLNIRCKSHESMTA